MPQFYDKIDKQLYCCKDCALHNNINEKNLVELSDEYILQQRLCEKGTNEFWHADFDIYGELIIVPYHGETCAICIRMFSFVRRNII